MAETIQKGDLAQSVISADLLKKGYKIAIPFGQDWRFDLIFSRDDRKFERIQCKHVVSENGSVTIRNRSCSEWKAITYDKDDFEWLACYDATTGRCIYIHSTDFRGMRSSMRIRVQDYPRYEAI